ncbi:hypothetical protein AMK21_00995 [Streptomyces sp. CB00316]|uniref:hypothetical protein n=1 Tax=unclassified Streptomyces TaxID=2593676 RepID=UPI00093C70DE|nr:MULTISPECIES: hypothetical protein [unclassified Streptomyces]MBT2428626.1 hypothetical protein [Streptomyces sp. ISL-112]MBT2464027.1 hypothetical protein [Streptomyces sp. ISL-63]OKJ23591.1 hypothetical protein AMK21_00995 [Streptomyces sp. CB00316]
MQRGLVHALAWLLATGAAVTLSWWGVHTVMTGTAYDPPRAVPISVGAGAPQRIGQSTEEPLVSSTHRPSPSPSPSLSAGGSSASPSPSAARPSRTPSSAPAPPPASPEPAANSGEVKGYRTDGGRVVFELGKSSAKLVSATPEPGWSMQVWTNDAWIRVDFSDGGGVDGKTYSVFCTWNGTPPTVQVVEP